MKTKKRIGIVSYWGWGRGMSYLMLCAAKMIKEEYDVYILKQDKKKIQKEYENDFFHVTEYGKYNVDKEFFTDWVNENELDAVIFNEYNQWTVDENNLVDVAKKLGVRVYGYLVLERFKPEHAANYDRIIASSVTFERFMRAHKVRNFTYVPYSIDFNEFPHPDEYKKKREEK